MCEDQQLLAWQGDIRKRMRLFQLDAEPEDEAQPLPSSAPAADATHTQTPVEKMETDQKTTNNPA